MSTELLSPAGSFDAGYYALANGADALYLGLSAFSARKAAKNFSLDEFARIKALAESKEKKIYAALNTLIRDEEMPTAVELLYDLDALGVDGVIVQDFGLLSVIRKQFPRIAVHASTQMGIHNSAGVRVLQRAGVSRIILARELRLDEIARIRRECPGIELEVFIHGALCYSFSGLCLASGMLLGRSGNRGECAQLCRNDYSEKGGVRRYSFSRPDLCLGERVLRLRDMGISALKIEGRMKSPAWVAAVTAYYRAVLDAKSAAEQESLLEKSRIIFSRKTSTGFFEGESDDGEALFSLEYPGHIGVPAGVAESGTAGGKGFTMRLLTDLAVRDGLLYFSPGSKAGGCLEGHAFAVSALYRAGKKTSFARRGELVYLPEPDIRGVALRKISSHDALLPSAPRLPGRRRVPVQITLRILPESFEFSAFSPAGIFPVFCAAFPLRPQMAQTPRPFADIAAVQLLPPGNSRFEAAGSPGFENESGLPGDGIYISPSVLKSIRREACEKLEAHYLSHRQAKVAAANGKSECGSADGLCYAQAPRRELIKDAGTGFPFVIDPEALSAEHLFRDSQDLIYLPLFPVLLHEADAYLKAAEKFIRRFLEEKPAPAGRCLVGLCNACHLELAHVFAEESRVGFFIDYGLYCANRHSVEFFAGKVKRIAFSYPWIESQAEAAFAKIEGFQPPLFITRGRRESTEFYLRQGKREFVVKSVSVAGIWLELVFCC